MKKQYLVDFIHTSLACFVNIDLVSGYLQIIVALLTIVSLGLTIFKRVKK